MFVLSLFTQFSSTRNVFFCMNVGIFLLEKKAQKNTTKLLTNIEVIMGCEKISRR